ncbi:hypothetical protein JXA47_06045 [Candidatus Sumerlaeota bacterium]|nr:hypothetical protein [Candidatus Sumerlaeota bacterium]
MEDQAKASPPLDGGTGLFEHALRWLGALAFVAFALLSMWEWVTYTPDPQAAAPFLSPPAYPNTLLVKFSLGEYLETFGSWSGEWLPGLAWLWGLTLLLIMVASWALIGMSGVRGLWSLLAAVLLGGCALMSWLELALMTMGVPALGAQLAALGVAVCLAALATAALLPVPRVRWSLRRLRHARLSRLPRMALWPVGALLLLAFLAASTPPIESDGLRYHLAPPILWAHWSAVWPIEGLAFSHFPFLVEMLEVGHGVATKISQFALFLLVIALALHFAFHQMRWARVDGKRRRGALGLTLALAATIPALTITSTWSFIDAGVVCFLLAAFFAHALWWHTGRGSHLLLAAVLTGLMLGTKYTALVPALVLGVGVLAHRTPTLEDLPYTAIERLSNGLVFGLIALAIGSPWYIRNWVQMGNPVYPLANEAFHAEGWDAECQALWEEKAAQKGVGYDWRLVGAAWRGATFAWAGGPGVGEGGFEDQSIGLTPWLLAPLGLAGLALIAMRRGGWWWFYLVFIAVNFVLWFRTYQSNRLLLSTLLVALPGAVVGLAELTRRWRAMWIAAVFALGVASVYQGLWIARYFMLESYPLQLALGFMDPDEWRSTRLNYFDGARAIEALVPEDESALVIGESRRFYFPPSAVMSDWYDPPAVRRYLEGAESVEDLTEALASDNITHVLINHAELFPLWAIQPDMLRPDGTVDAAAYWGAWLSRDPIIPERGNLAYFRGRFDDAQAALLAQWLSTVPHRVTWHGDRAQTVGVELWRIGSE